MMRRGWRTLEIAAVVTDVLDFRGRTPKKLGMDWGDGSIPALSAVNVRYGSLDLGRTSHFGSLELYRKWMSKGDTSRGDILITTEAPLGNIAQIPDDQAYILSQRVILLKPNRDVVDSDFLAQQMSAADFQAALHGSRSGSTVAGIRQSRLVALPIQVPSLNEQRRIVAKLEALQTRSRRARDARRRAAPARETPPIDPRRRLPRRPHKRLARQKQPHRTCPRSPQPHPH